MKKVSFIIPNFNTSKYIVALIDSIKNIDKSIIDYVQVIIVDDNSTDDSVEIINKQIQGWEKTFELVQKETNGHHGSAINEGLKYVKASKFCFIDSDDILNVDTFRKYWDDIVDDNNDVVSFSFLAFQSDEEDVNNVSNKQKKLLRFWNSGGSPTIICTFITSKFVKYCQLPEGIPYDDTVLRTIAHTRANVFKKIYNNNSIMYYRQRIGQSMKSFNSIEGRRQLLANYLFLYLNGYKDHIETYIVYTELLHLVKKEEDIKYLYSGDNSTVLSKFGTYEQFSEFVNYYLNLDKTMTYREMVAKSDKLYDNKLSVRLIRFLVTSKVKSIKQNLNK